MSTTPRYSFALTMGLSLLPVFLSAQGLASYEPRNRTVLIEQFCGVANNNSPSAESEIDELGATWPGKVVIVRAHAGVFAAPLGDDLDLRNGSASGIHEEFQVNFTPSALINRSSFDSWMLLIGDQWEPATEVQLALASPVNLGMETIFDPDTRQLTITVELFYTANGTGGADRISVFVKEDHLLADQLDNTSTPPLVEDYDHQHVLRTYVTDLWGEEVPQTDSGTTVLRTYSYTIPEDWNVENCSVVAYVSEYKGTIYQVREFPATGGSTVNLEEKEAGALGDVRFQIHGTTLEVQFAEMTSTPLRLVLYDASGRQVHEHRIVTGTMNHRASTDALATGVYLCTLHDGVDMVSKRVVLMDH
ncbi:MAG: Omp28-related outer membrane protein [Flavobacteriales bacterium]|nr:Omp28-related outer membrane protein [Flavobacteriales bacterium]